MAFWSEKIDALWEVSRAYKEGKLTLVLGAGVSMGCGLPSWPKLVQDLYIEVCRLNYNNGNGHYGSFDQPKGWGGLQIAMNKVKAGTLDSLPLTIQSRFCKNHLGKSYKKMLQKTLYKDGYVLSNSLQAITKLEKLKAICTYNYDNLIEISAKKNKFISISEPQKVPANRIPVYHVHGFLPADLKKQPKGNIVFSEDEYHEVYLNFGHWSNLTQLNIFMDSGVVLFLGLSFNDPNLRRLLDGAIATKKDLKLYNICKLPIDKSKITNRSSDHSANAELSVYEQVYKDIGVTNIWMDDYEPDIPFFLEAIICDDPILSYTEAIREYFLKPLLQNGNSSVQCDIVGCKELCLKDFSTCANHALHHGFHSGSVPILKSLNDRCLNRGCNRISSGLSGKCIIHLSSKNKKK